VQESAVDLSPEQSRREYEQARLRLARLRVEGGDTFREVLQQAMEVAASTLDVERVGVWLFVNERSALRCFEVYERSKRAHSEGAVLRSADFPTYFRALDERANVPVADARSDPLTQELGRSYLEPLGIVSMLDAPIFRNGRVIGVICHEHVGAPRAWTAQERDFATSMADTVALRIENAARLEAERRLQAHATQLSELSEMEALGRLAAGIAHDFNNMLSIVLAHASRLAALPGAGEQVVESAREIEQAARRGAGLVQELLAFGRESALEPRVLDVGRVVEEFSGLLQTALGPRHALEVTRAASTGRVLIDRSQLERLVLNLCVNARDAMPDGGGVQITICEVRVGAEAEVPGVYVMLSVSDHGVGMDDDVRAHLFEPFFTTKPAGKGTGLGLAIVYRIVERCGGFIHVESAPGRGSTFRIYLPRVAAES